MKALLALAAVATFVLLLQRLWAWRAQRQQPENRRQGTGYGEIWPQVYPYQHCIRNLALHVGRLYRRPRNQPERQVVHDVVRNTHDTSHDHRADIAPQARGPREPLLGQV